MSEKENRKWRTLEVALDWGRKGFKIFPATNSKKPAVKGSWKTEASAHPKKIRDMWRSTKDDTLIGLPCGENNIVVLDFDIYKPGSESGRKEFEELFGVDLSEHPYVVKSQRGGYHYYFRMPDDIRIPCAANWLEIKGLDIRGEGGYIIAADEIRYHTIRGSIENIEEFPSEMANLFAPTGQTIPHDYTDDVVDDSVVATAERLTDPRLSSALDCIPADDRNEWCLGVGAALHNKSGGSEAGYLLWDKWSQRSKKYQGQKDTNTQWNSFAVGHANPKTEASIYRLAYDHGWDGGDSQPVTLNQTIATAEIMEVSSFTAQVMADLTTTFKRNQHHPSEGQLDALENIVTTIDGMANNTLKDLVYLSAIDPGVGKTQTVVHCIRRMVSSEQYRDIGIMILVSRLQEIRTLVEEMGLKNDRYAVIVGDSKDNRELNNLGNQCKTDAQVLFTTQQMLEVKLKGGRRFSELSDFVYRGRVRKVRVWDEAMLPARPIIIDITDIEHLTKTLKPHRALRDIVSEFIDVVRCASDRARIEVPNFEEKISLARALDIFSEASVATKKVVGDLWFIGGKVVNVRKERGHNTAVAYENSLPDDLKPVLVLDASGRVRKTYSHWSEGRGDLVKIKDAVKDYGSLTVHLWKHGGGKQSWKDDPETLIRGVLSAIRERPKEEWLIVHHKSDRNFDVDVPALLEKELSREIFENLKFVHWGDHSATNAYRDISNVILAGTLFYPIAYYESIGRLSRGIESSQKLTEEQFREIQFGEHMHLILQAACRGSVRKSRGPGCYPCHLYLIAHPRHGIPSLLGTIFPGCKIVDWNPVRKELKGRRSEAFEYVIDSLDRGYSELPFSSVYKGLGMSGSDFRKDVSSHADFISSLAEQGIRTESRKGKLGSVFVKVEGSKSALPVRKQEIGRRRFE